ncbi:hypothetical protein [Marinigracilibium pacificum]|uniref:Uncharacterized protein n=1 Tax=Marinigracilibium pacificum TaxID=2729599 RepID=A0A848IRD4_9BACT|nr:hypothetical protein [Marinigracilibium pacificum]NMM46917.1 hypothetical protein [Marinigracilibium pacificum]
MILVGDILVDPSRKTITENKKPGTLTKKLFYYLTAGVFSEKIEKETFEAVQILQQLYAVLQSVEIDNIVRLQVDGQDTYFDNEGLKNDLSSAISKFENLRKQSSSEFDTLKMILEHSDSFFNYFIIISYQSIHEQGKFPIRVRVFGLFKEFEATNTENAERLKVRLSPIFKNQEGYNLYVKGKKSRFDSFLKSLRLNFKRNIDSDEIIHEEIDQLLIGLRDIKSVKDIPLNPDVSLPIFHGYYDLNKKVFYSYLWTDLLIESEFWINNTTIVSASGEVLKNLGPDHYFLSRDNSF